MIRHKALPGSSFVEEPDGEWVRLGELQEFIRVAEEQAFSLDKYQKALELIADGSYDGPSIAIEVALDALEQ